MRPRDPAVAHRRIAITWACTTIARLAPHLRLEALPEGHWRVWWRATDTDPEEIPFDGPDLDWRGLCQFARAVQADHRAEVH